MIKSVETLENIEIYTRKLLISQAEVEGKYVLNALQLKGPTMHQNVGTNGEMIFKSFAPTDTVIIFELIEQGHSEDMSEERFENSDELFVFVQYKISIIIYGSNSGLVSQKLKARLLSSECRDDLFSHGINLQTISTIESASEFINSSLWLRRDMTLYISCYFKVNKLISEKSMQELGELKIYTTE